MSFFQGLTGGIATGYNLGVDQQERKKDTKYREGLVSTANAQPTQNPDGTYSFLGQTYQTALTPGLTLAARQGQMANTMLEYGDPTQGINLQQKAVQNRAAEIQRIATQAVMSGDLGQIRNAYRLVNDGRDVDFRETGDGVVEVFNPKSGRVLMSGSQGEIVDTLARQMAPETFYEMAMDELKMTKEQVMIQNYLSQIEQRSVNMGRDAVESRQQALSTARQRIQDQMERRVKAGDTQGVAELERLLTAVEQVEAQQGGVTLPSGGAGTGVDINSPAAQTVIRIAQEEGVDPAVALSVWQQESGGSTDLGLRGETLPEGHTYAGHYARGPWQIMSFHGPNIGETFEDQTRWAMRHLRERGVDGYYGSSSNRRPTGMPNHPSGAEYQSEVLRRADQLRRGLGGQSQEYAQQAVSDAQRARQPKVTDTAIQAVQDDAQVLFDQKMDEMGNPRDPLVQERLQQEAYQEAIQRRQQLQQGLSGTSQPQTAAPMDIATLADRVFGG